MRPGLNLLHISFDFYSILLSIVKSFEGQILSFKSLNYVIFFKYNN